MKTLLKWPGGKENELSIISSNIPCFSGRYIEPFLGGGAVFFNINNSQCHINDKSEELINFYQCIKTNDSDLSNFLKKIYSEFSDLTVLVKCNDKDILDLYTGLLSIQEFHSKFSYIFDNIANKNNGIFIKELYKNLNNKINRSRTLENNKGSIPEKDKINNIEAALKSAYYMFVRALLNDKKNLTIGEQAAVFFFIREFCYSSMFRYNSKGEFNVPYGGISYNRKDFQKKIDYILSTGVTNKLNEATLYSEDFETFIEKLNLQNDDFMFLDPPYDSEFSTYSKNTFSKEDQIRLSKCLKITKAKFMLIIKNTDFIYSLYENNFYIKSFNKKYLVSFMNRNNRATEHLIITNYQI